MVVARPGFAAALALDQVSELVYRAVAVDGRPGRIFGGQIMAQSLAAAGRTVQPDQHPHMLHARFAGPGDPARPLVLTLDPIDDGGSFSRRRVVVTQEGKQVLELSASFHRDEAGPEHQALIASSSSPDAVPSVDDLPPYDERTRQWWARLTTWLPVEIRSNVIPGRWAAPGPDPAEPRQQLWLRTRDELPDDRLMHSCAAAYASDLFLLTAAMVRHGVRHDDGGVFAVTLNHTMWFHHPFRADHWWLYDQEGVWTGAGRSLCRGQMFDRSGRLVATSMQEGLLRVRDGVPRTHPPRLPAAERTVHPVPSRGARAESERSTCTCR
ncbi:MAG TPA: acyl-CoA thioesterase domain-containing protein [Jatrophihabitantaceae bacterium]|jgi:acyl-CoA thioesterase-2